MESKKYFLFLLLIFGVFFSSAAWAQGAKLFTTLPAALSARQKASEQDPTIIRSRYVRINFGLLKPKKGIGAPGEVVLNLFDDLSLTAVKNRIKRGRRNTHTWTGEIRDREMGQATLVFGNGDMTGNISTLEGFYQIRPIGNGVHGIYEIDQSAYPKCAGTSQRPNLQQYDTEAFAPMVAAAGDDGSVIDVMVVYTQIASNASGNIGQEIDQAIEDTNLSYENSDITQRVRLVHATEVVYDEPGNIFTDLDRLKNPADGYLDEVHALRDKYGADIVLLMVENGGGWGGRAFLMNNVSTGFESWAFGVVHRLSSTGNYAFGHELGHIMSARHDWHVTTNAGSPFTYNHGYVNTYTSSKWRTIMAYPDLCKENEYNCPPVKHWSNPYVNYGGAPTGIPEGDYHAADNHKALNNTANVVANFRDSAAAGCTDKDNDGYYAEEDCGTEVDTDDNDPETNPGMPEVCGDEKDNNSDGEVDEGCQIIVPDDYPTIQRAINAASSNGAEVLVRDGTYKENINFNGKEITVKSENGPDFTTIDGNQDVIVIGFGSDENGDSVLDGFHVTNGEHGLYFSRYSSSKIINCKISNNSAKGITCGMYSSPKIINCIITNNVGGGIRCEEYSSPTISNCTISNNSSSGGISCYRSSAIIINCTIIDNTGAYGGGVDSGGDLNYGGVYHTPTIEGCTITGNKATGYNGGGGIYCWASWLKISNSIIKDNTSSFSGGGISCYDASPQITNCIISDNSAKNRGGGVFSRFASPTLTNCTISGNLAGGDGGGIALISDSDPDHYSSSTISNCTISGNSAGEGGGGILCSDYSRAVVWNNILWGNMATADSKEIYLRGSINVTYSNIEGGWTGEGNINEDPLFVNPRPATEAPTSDGDYRLRPGSPCIDAGTGDTITYPSLPTDDIEGKMRPYDGDGNGTSEYDMGAYEFGSKVAGDVNGDDKVTPADALKAFQHYLGLTELDASQQVQADVNGDGSITPSDALCIFKKYMGFSSCLDN